VASRTGPVFDPRVRRRAIQGDILLDDVARKRLARSRMRRALAVAALIGALAAVVAVYFSPLLRVQNVNVVGTVAIPPDEIAAMVDVDGESMIAVDFGEAREQIEANPLVKGLGFEKHWPQTIEVTVVERVTWGSWIVGETTYAIDDEGVVLPFAAPAAPAPAIRATNSTAILSAGDHTDADAVLLARTLTEQVPARLGLNLTALEWQNASGLTLTNDAGYRVVIGDSENIDYKLAVWAQIEAEVGRENMAGRTLDLRFGDRPVLQ